MRRYVAGFRTGTVDPARGAIPSPRKITKWITPAVTAGLTLQSSSGMVEDHVNRIKTIKRATHGRASFHLLRTRILLRS
ncbi:hypothetical protein [Streptomyces sp. NPDC020362]|uniref:hypothetical protein n=1 Tax=unclassified Streptomyces TaxID=2593676 RepID=UPI000B0E6B78